MSKLSSALNSTPSGFENRLADVKMVLNNPGTGKLITLTPTVLVDDRLKLNTSLNGPADAEMALKDVGMADAMAPRLVLEACACADAKAATATRLLASDFNCIEGTPWG